MELQETVGLPVTTKVRSANWQYIHDSCKPPFHTFSDDKSDPVAGTQRVMSGQDCCLVKQTLNWIGAHKKHPAVQPCTCTYQQKPS